MKELLHWLGKITCSTLKMLTCTHPFQAKVTCVFHHT